MKIRNWMLALSIVSCGAVLAMMNNCAGYKSASYDGSSLGATQGPSAGFLAFQQGLYAFGKKQGCVSCHASVSPPFFLQPDATASYQAAKGLNDHGQAYVDFSNPDSSEFITYAGNSHCGLSLCSNPAISSTVQPLIEAWAAAESSDSGGSQTPTTKLPNYYTATIALPGTGSIPTLVSGQTALVRFPLSGLNKPVAALNGAYFELQIQVSAQGGNQYIVSSPRIAGATAQVNLSGIHVYIRASGGSGIGVEDQSTGNVWNALTATVATSTLPNPLPTTPFTTTPLAPTSGPTATESMPFGSLPTTADSMTIGFDTLN